MKIEITKPERVTLLKGLKMYQIMTELGPYFLDEEDDKELLQQTNRDAKYSKGLQAKLHAEEIDLKLILRTKRS